MRVLLCLLLSCAFVSIARADTMRCGNRLVTTGDSPYEVRSRCGEPVEALRRTELRNEQVWLNGRAFSRTVEVVIDEWTYDFGSHKFTQHLTFEQGTLIAVVSGSRGIK